MKFEFSAGGIVYKKVGDKTLILISQHSQHHGWVFPKGLIGDKIKNEGKEDTAIREVEEETGIRAKILRSLNPTTYWYVFQEEKIRKTVYYFLMEFMGGNFAKRDHEMESVEWLPVEKVEDRLTYKSDKDVWQQAKGLINA